MIEAVIGPSPRVWGKPISTDPYAMTHVVHPHVCGENVGGCPFTPRQSGPSPRVWGKPFRTRQKQGTQRSIPTCVGKTVQPFLQTISVGVHPHVCGENGGAIGRALKPLGPSPRVWGKRYYALCHILALRSIPTCVGKTKSASNPLPVR